MLRFTFMNLFQLNIITCGIEHAERHGFQMKIQGGKI